MTTNSPRIMNTGLIIKKLRKCEGLSQAELAQALQVTRPYLSEIESGRRSAGIELLRSVSSYFDVPLALLVAWEEDVPANGDVHRQLQELFSRLLSIRLGQARSNYE